MRTACDYRLRGKRGSNYTGNRALLDHRSAGRARWRFARRGVSAIPNSIARVNARFGGRHRVEQSERQPARPRDSHGRSLPNSCTSPCVNAMPAQPVDAARRASVAIEHRRAADVIARGSQHSLRELPGVAQAEVEALARDRMQRLRRVAEQHATRVAVVAVANSSTSGNAAALGDPRRSRRCARAEMRARARRGTRSSGRSSNRVGPLRRLRPHQRRSDRAPGSSAIGPSGVNRS